MTENKRFERIYGDIEVVCIDYDSIGEDRFFDDGDYDKFVKSLNELHEENEQLQFKLKECNDNKLFSRRELEKENERIKHMIQEAYETERTQIGKNVLKQLLDCIGVME